MKIRPCLILVAPFVLSLTTPVSAQQAGSALPVLQPLIRITQPEDDLISVTERFRPDYQPRGIRAGSFLVYPSVRTAAGYDSNIFGNQTDKTDDALYSIEPEITARSTWARNELRLYARARHLDYLDTRNAGQPSYAIGADGHFGMNLPLRLELGANYGQLIERRDSSAFPLGQVSPARFRQAIGYVRGIYDAGTIRVIGTADISNFSFSTVRALNDDGEVVSRISQSFRDHTESRGALRIEAAVAPRIATFVQGSYGHTGYDDDRISVNGPANRDGNEFQVLGGATFDLALFRGELGVGYVRRSYDAPIYSTINGVAFNGRLTYYASPLLTVTAEGSRTVEETAILGSSGFLSTRASVQADYELRRNLILNGNVGYRYNNFRGTPREDKVFRVSSGARYSVSRRWALDANAIYVDRNASNAPGVPDFKQLQVIVGTTFRL
jgi:hypothetical protein